MTALAALVALPLLAGASDASASCQGRKDTGMVLGGVGGALVGNAVSHGGGRTGGTILGGLGGAVLGHQIAKSGCRHYTRHAYYRRSHHDDRYATNTPGRVYYDQRGNPVPVAGGDYYAPR